MQRMNVEHILNTYHINVGANERRHATASHTATFPADEVLAKLDLYRSVSMCTAGKDGNEGESRPADQPVRSFLGSQSRLLDERLNCNVRLAKATKGAQGPLFDESIVESCTHVVY